MERIAKWLNRKYDGSPMMKKIGEAVYRFVNRNLWAVVAVAILGIVMAVVGHYGKMGFDWRWFLFFELPLYLFLGWAVWKTIGIYRKSKELGRKNNSEKA